MTLKKHGVRKVSMNDNKNIEELLDVLATHVDKIISKLSDVSYEKYQWLPEAQDIIRKLEHESSEAYHPDVVFDGLTFHESLRCRMDRVRGLVRNLASLFNSIERNQ